MSKLFTLDALTHWASFLIGCGLVLFFTGPWDKGFTCLMIGMGVGFWLGRFGG